MGWAFRALSPLLTCVSYFIRMENRALYPGGNGQTRNQDSDKPVLCCHQSLHLPIKMNLTWIWLDCSTHPIHSPRDLGLKAKYSNNELGQETAVRRYLHLWAPILLPIFMKPTEKNEGNTQLFPHETVGYGRTTLTIQLEMRSKGFRWKAIQTLANQGTLLVYVQCPESPP